MRKNMRCILSALLTFLFIPMTIAAGDEVLFSWHPNESKKIAITFDDGPHPVYTPEILEILAEYGVRATFFVVGENAEWYPELVRKELAAGHELGTHTYRHANLRKSGYNPVLSEILDMENAVYENAEYRCHLLRPPGGLYGDPVCHAAEMLDYTVILWSIDTRDWAHTPRKTIVDTVLDQVKSGDIILFHDYIGGGDSPTPDALRRILPELISRGYRFVTVSELLASA